MIENYFDRNFELESFLEKKGQYEYLELVRNIGSKVDIYAVRQKEQLGLGHAILCAKPFIQQGESFAVILADDLVLHPKPVTAQLLEVADEVGHASVIGVMEVPLTDTYKYGIVNGQYLDSNRRLLKMNDMVEKPSSENAPTNLATPGRYILNSHIFSCLEKIEKGAGGEYQLTDAIRMYLNDFPTYAYKFDGVRYDTGNVAGYLKATVDFALADPSTRDFMIEIIREKARALV
jgi:UTP--glucose-1-phosphate uridylyltransferase